MRVHVSLPLGGPLAAAGREVLRGAELALERSASPPVELVVHDGFAPDREARAVEIARAAAADRGAVAYVGDFHSSQVMATAPILGAAGLLQVAPVATFIGLGGPTLVRITPHDGAGARAVAAWAAEQGVRELLVVHDHDDGYGAPVGAMCAEAARDRGVAVRIRPVWDAEEREADDLGAADAVLYAGVAGSGAIGMWHALHEARPDAWLLGTDGVAADWLARALAPPVAARTRFFVAARAPLGFYGFEAMALVLDAIAAGAGDRAAIVRAARATRDRERSGDEASGRGRAVIGRYSIDAEGHTTATAYGRLAVVDGALAWDR